jgi:hypothetical protein
MHNENSNLVIDPFLGSNDDVKLILRVLKSLRSLLKTKTKKTTKHRKVLSLWRLTDLARYEHFLGFSPVLRIRIRDPGWVESQHPNPGSGIEKSRIRDPG